MVAQSFNLPSAHARTCAAATNADMLDSTPPTTAVDGAADVILPVRIPRAEGCRERDADDGALCDSAVADAKWAERDSGSTFSLPCALAFACEFAFKFAFALDCAAAARIAVNLARAAAAESPFAGVSDNEEDDDEDVDEEEENVSDDDAKVPSDDFGRRFDANGDAAPNAASACGDNAAAADDEEDTDAVDEDCESPCTAPADRGRWFECAATDGESSIAEAGR